MASLASLDLTIHQLNNQPRLTLTIGNPVRSSVDDEFYRSMCHVNATTRQSEESVIDVDDLHFYSRYLKIREIQAHAVDNVDPAEFFYD